MRRTYVALLVCALALSGVAVVVVPAGAAIDECDLLSDSQAKTIMRAKPYGPGTANEYGECTWQTDPYDRQHLAGVTVKVEKRAKLLARYDDDLRTYIDESTNVGIDPLPGVGDEAFSVYDPLTGPGASSGIDVAVGKRILSISYIPAKRVENPSPEFDQIVKIVKKVVAKVRKG